MLGEVAALREAKGAFPSHWLRIGNIVSDFRRAGVLLPALHPFEATGCLDNPIDTPQPYSAAKRFVTPLSEPETNEVTWSLPPPVSKATAMPRGRCGEAGGKPCRLAACGGHLFALVRRIGYVEDSV